MARVLAALLALCACMACARAQGVEVFGEASAHRVEATPETPAWLAKRSLRSWRINGDTWHKIALISDGSDPLSASLPFSHSASGAWKFGGNGQRHFFYCERTRQTAWALPRHAPRGASLWEASPLGPPLLSTAPLCWPECAADWATILAPVALLIAAKHAHLAAAAARCAGCAAGGRVKAVRIAMQARRAAGAAPKAD